MSAPSLPSGYDVAKHVRAGRVDCHLTVGFDQHQTHIPRFLVQLHYHVSAAPLTWEAIARMDHNETAATGHDVYHEGLHVDIARRQGDSVHLRLAHGTLPRNRGAVIRGCVEYFRREAGYFVDVYEGRRSPGRPPGWRSDGGEPARTFIRPNTVEGGMSREAPADETLSLEELSEVLADATDTTTEDLERQAAALEIAPPDEATVVDE